MKPTPKGWPRVTPAIAYKDAGAMIDWLCKAYGFEIRLKVEGDPGFIVHSELTYGTDGLIMVSSEKPAEGGSQMNVSRLSAATVKANTQSLMVFVDDADAHCAHASAAGATIVTPVADHDYGEDYWTDRSYGATDPEGHLWWFTQRIRDPK